MWVFFSFIALETYDNCRIFPVKWAICLQNSEVNCSCEIGPQFPNLNGLSWSFPILKWKCLFCTGKYRWMNWWCGPLIRIAYILYHFRTVLCHHTINTMLRWGFTVSGSNLQPNTGLVCLQNAPCHIRPNSTCSKHFDLWILSPLSLALQTYWRPSFLRFPFSMSTVYFRYFEELFKCTILSKRNT